MVRFLTSSTFAKTVKFQDAKAARPLPQNDDPFFDTLSLDTEKLIFEDLQKPLFSVFPRPPGKNFQKCSQKEFKKQIFLKNKKTFYVFLGFSRIFQKDPSKTRVPIKLKRSIIALFPAPQNRPFKHLFSENLHF
jgi:hypothetical protein